MRLKLTACLRACHAQAPKLTGGLTSSSNKRKATDGQAAIEAQEYSSMETNVFAHRPELNVKGKQRATVSVSEDAAAGSDEDMVEDQSFAPGNDADYFIEDDSEGRFFGGGLSNTQKEILDIFDGQDQIDEDANNGGGSQGGAGDAAQTLTTQGVRRQLLGLERAINKNSEMRVKWSGQPEKLGNSPCIVR